MRNGRVMTVRATAMDWLFWAVVAYVVGYMIWALAACGTLAEQDVLDDAARALRIAQCVERELPPPPALTTTPHTTLDPWSEADAGPR